MKAASPANSGRSIPVPYGGWRARKAALRLADGSHPACHPLVRTIATPAAGLTAEVIDLGRGTLEEFEAHSAEIKGRIVLVRHELDVRRRHHPSPPQVRRGARPWRGGLPDRRPAQRPCRGGLVGPTGAATGSRPSASRPRRRRGWRGARAGYPTVTMTIETEEAPAETETLLYDYPGKTDEWVVLSAHVDGHDLAESAMDNGTGLAERARRDARAGAARRGFRRGLRVMFFSVEEWALTGSAQYVGALSAAERAKIALNVNLDSVAGSPNLAALSSGYAGVEPFILGTAEANGLNVRTVRPLMTNSDHANFAQGGIPALRLVVGFDDPAANLRVVPDPADTRDKVGQGELRGATLFTAALVAAACNADPAEAARWRKSRSPVIPTGRARARRSWRAGRRIDKRGPSSLRGPRAAPLGMT